MVVSVIAAILAAVCIPVYTGYVNSQKQTVVDNLAQTAATAANILTRRAGPGFVLECATTADCIGLLKIYVSDPSKYLIVVKDGSAKVTDASNTDIYKSVPY